MIYYRWQAFRKDVMKDASIGGDIFTFRKDVIKYTSIGGGIFVGEDPQDARDRCQREAGNRFKDGTWEDTGLDKWYMFVDNSTLQLDIIPEKYAKGILKKFGYDGDYFVNYDDVENQH